MPTRLGQNFLKDKGVVKKIIDSANLSRDDFVIEVGSGDGALTKELAKRAGKVLAIEIDKNLFALLNKKFSNHENVELFNEDILKINLSELLGHRVPELKEYKVIANLPYYITSPIIRLFLESKFPPKEMVLMVQKEVAERIIAKPGKMSILALAVQYYATPELLFYVSKDSFFPVPEVDSAVIRVAHNIQHTEKDIDETKKFFQVVRVGFSAKRKVLANNLANSFHLDKKKVEEKIKKAGINPVARAQELSIENWKKLMKQF